ncbi:putative sterol 3-beta-glucosyltransferase [Dioscorea sansibarensis]
MLDLMARESAGVEGLGKKERVFSAEAVRAEEGSNVESLDLSISASEESGLWDSPRPGLDHCHMAPIKYDSSSLLHKGHEIALSRSKTDKRCNRKPDILWDRLSESEKKKLIQNLVKIQHDGTVEVDVTRNVPVASELLELDALDASSGHTEDAISEPWKPIPRLKIAMLVVGTRGDVQVFLAFAKRLQEFGHHVRLATHVNFRTFVKSAGVEFYPLGGDPRIMAGYMAKNKGFLLSGPTEISIQRKQLKEIINSLLPACIEPDLDSGAPFKAEAIIANPPAYGHMHVAEALGVPLHIFFTMPWTPTYEFPHPLARVPQSAAYRLSYLVVDLIVWWGIRAFINEFRKRKLKLSPIAYFSTYHGSISHLPTGYMWSPHLVPKPRDWGALVDVVGFCFLDVGINYQPQQEFADWIKRGPKPIYIGFGSMPLEDAEKTTAIILEALKETGQRGILDRGWGHLGVISEFPADVFLLEDCPHDWLFPQCAAVVHHGGAGTTATGLRAGCPTTVVPFFGDQFFWGDRIHERGVGPAPIPVHDLNVECLSNAIKFMLDPEVKIRTMELGKLIEEEDGTANAVNAFHRHLPLELPIPPSLEEPPNTLQWLLLTIEKWCCLPCST